LNCAPPRQAARIEFSRSAFSKEEEPMKTPAKIGVLPALLRAACCATVMIALPAAAQIANPPGTVGGNPATNNAGSDTGISGAIQEKPLLTPAQRSAIYAEVTKDPSKSSPQHFSAVIGADVPPMIELYALPEDALAGNQAATLYKYTMVENKVVVVDPTKMRVVDVIGPSAKGSSPKQ
jgi:Protein of unknown function (DUF1236)